jgi:hypothetical protein
MASKTQVESAILAREGFRVELQLFDGKKPALPPYEYAVMAPQRWKISDWKNARLAEYRLLAKGMVIFGGDGVPISRDLQLGKLRDSYYENVYGQIEPPQSESDSKVVPIERAKRR